MAAVFAAMSAFVYARVDRALTASLDRDLELQAREVRSHVESDRGLLDPDTAEAASLAQLVSAKNTVLTSSPPGLSPLLSGAAVEQQPRRQRDPARRRADRDHGPPRRSHGQAQRRRPQARLPGTVLARAFERFSRADEARGRGGSGLGLAIVDLIARSHGGAAGIANREGSGVKIWLTVPRAASECSTS